MSRTSLHDLKELLREFRAKFHLSPDMDHHFVIVLKKVTRTINRWGQHYAVKDSTRPGHPD